MQHTPLVSICIPTYNRGDYLRNALEHICSEEIFINTDDVEILVGDNASTDSTEIVCRQFAQRFPSKFVYVRQNSNIGAERNTLSLFKMARGQFIKVQNDYFFFRPGGLSCVLAAVKEFLNDKPVLYFRNQERAARIIECRTHDELLSSLSYISTWIGGFGFWREDLEVAISEYEKWFSSLLPQTSVMWRLFDVKKRAIVVNERVLSDGKEFHNKASYNFAKVFSYNYFTILRQFLGRGKISRIAYEVEKKNIFDTFIYPRYYDFSKEWQYGREHYLWHMRKYWLDGYFWIGCVTGIWRKYYYPYLVKAYLISPQWMKDVYRKCKKGLWL